MFLHYPRAHCMTQTGGQLWGIMITFRAIKTRTGALKTIKFSFAGKNSSFLIKAVFH